MPYKVNLSIDLLNYNIYYLLLQHNRLKNNSLNKIYNFSNKFRLFNCFKTFIIIMTFLKIYFSTLMYLVYIHILNKIHIDTMLA